MLVIEVYLDYYDAMNLRRLDHSMLCHGAVICVLFFLFAKNSLAGFEASTEATMNIAATQADLISEAKKAATGAGNPIKNDRSKSEKTIYKQKDKNKKYRILLFGEGVLIAVAVFYLFRRRRNHALRESVPVYSETEAQPFTQLNVPSTRIQPENSIGTLKSRIRPTRKERIRGHEGAEKDKRRVTSLSPSSDRKKISVSKPEQVVDGRAVADKQKDLVHELALQEAQLKKVLKRRNRKEVEYRQKHQEKINKHQMEIETLVFRFKEETQKKQEELKSKLSETEHEILRKKQKAEKTREALLQRLELHKGELKAGEKELNKRLEHIRNERRARIERRVGNLQKNRVSLIEAGLKRNRERRLADQMRKKREVVKEIERNVSSVKQQYKQEMLHMKQEKQEKEKQLEKEKNVISEIERRQQRLEMLLSQLNSGKSNTPEQ